MHIPSTQVECPCDIIKCRHEHTVGMETAQSLADEREFLFGRLTGQFYGLYLHLIIIGK